MVEMTNKQREKKVEIILKAYNGSVCSFGVPKPIKKSIKSVVAFTGTAGTNVTELIHEIRK